MNQDIDTNNEELDFDPDSMLQDSIIIPPYSQSDFEEKKPFEIIAKLFWDSREKDQEVENFLFQRDLLLKPLKAIHGIEKVHNIYILQKFIEEHKNETEIKSLIELSFKTFGYNAVHTSNFYKNYCELKINKINPSEFYKSGTGGTCYPSIEITDQESIEKYCSQIADRSLESSKEVLIEVYQGKSLLIDQRRIFQKFNYQLSCEPLSLKFSVSNS